MPLRLPALGLPQPPRLGRTQLRHAARIVIACGVAWGAVTLLGLPEGYWSLITVIAVMHPDLGGTLGASRDRVIGTLIGAVVGGAAIWLRLRYGFPTVPLFTVALVPLALLTGMWSNMRLSCTTLIIVFLVPTDGAPFAWALDRVVEIVLGTLVALAVTVLVFPGRKAGEVEPEA